VAVLVNEKPIPSTGPTDTVQKFSPRAAEDLARIETLVRTAVGVDTTRGDEVSVVSLPFETRKVTVAPAVAPDIASRVEQFQRPALSAIGLLLAFGLALIAMKSLKGATTGSQNASLPRATAVAGALAAAPAPAPAPQVPVPQAIPLPPPPPPPPAPPKYHFQAADTEIRDRVIATVEHDADAAVRLAKAWIKEG